MPGAGQPKAAPRETDKPLGGMPVFVLSMRGLDAVGSLKTSGARWRGSMAPGSAAVCLRRAPGLAGAALAYRQFGLLRSPHGRARQNDNFAAVLNFSRQNPAR